MLYDLDQIRIGVLRRHYRDQIGFDLSSAKPYGGLSIIQPDVEAMFVSMFLIRS